MARKPPVLSFIDTFLFWRVAVVVRQGAATTHRSLWGGAATQNGSNRRRQKETVSVRLSTL
ncbi:hypothetical protein BFW86_07940 [Pseudomonas fluorescens]|nr:hypothetical protein BFW86_07940 [Pseudomonas fluorescens]